MTLLIPEKLNSKTNPQTIMISRSRASELSTLSKLAQSFLL